MNMEALYQIPYGLYVLTTRDGEKENGCIINTVMQVTDKPVQVVVAVNKSNYSHDLMIKSGTFNLSVLTEQVPFSVFEQFGFQSGKEVNKFAGQQVTRGNNGVAYLEKDCNSYFECQIKEVMDAGTHSLFLAEITEAEVFSQTPSITYSYYHSHVKPKPEANPQQTGWRCKICGYVYEGETLPEDFVCPMCKHGAEDFEKIGEEGK